jgi:ribosomal protein S18 acetylase RimI-like enzyme
MNLEAYQPHFLRDLYSICLRTGDSGNDASAIYTNPDLLGHLYAAPYPVFDPGLTWLLCDSLGACGYVLGTRDSQAFARWMEAQWLPPLRKRYPVPGESEESRDARLLRILHRPYKAFPQSTEYPAHLHIDLLPRAQGQGWGRKLLEVFLGRLRELGVPGVHLGVGGRNKNAMAFYERMGFELLEEWPGGIARTYGMRL